MEWRDEGILLSVRPHGETAAIIEVLTRSHGRHLGLVHGGRSRRLRPVLQIGNHISVAWRARVSENLGVFSVELFRPFASEVLHNAEALAAVTSVAALASVLPERDAHPELFEITQFVFGYLSDDDLWPPLYVRWELALLDELGAGLDLTHCAATGSSDNLTFVSPRSGQAVSTDAGAPYAEKLFALPAFLVGASAEAASPTRNDVVNGLEMTGHFLSRRVFAPDDKELPEPRARLLRLLRKGVR
ncbi:MAG: DNA repair protein RecO [Pseudomonadota bacterium]